MQFQPEAGKLQLRSTLSVNTLYNILHKNGYAPRSSAEKTKTMYAYNLGDPRTSGPAVVREDPVRTDTETQRSGLVIGRGSYRTIQNLKQTTDFRKYQV
jgi:hypothetical protein